MLTSKSKVQYEWGFLAAGLEGWGIPRFVRCVVRAEREGFLSTSRTPVTRAESSPPPTVGVFGVLLVHYTLVKRASSQLRHMSVGQKGKLHMLPISYLELAIFLQLGLHHVRRQKEGQRCYTLSELC